MARGPLSSRGELAWETEGVRCLMRCRRGEEGRGVGEGPPNVVVVVDADGADAIRKDAGTGRMQDALTPSCLYIPMMFPRSRG